MRLKILVVPFSILFALILVIGYIKPDAVALQEKRVLLETKIAQQGNLSLILGNIDTLSQAMEQESTTETFVESFIPETMDQERVIDMFNFLASQSGVFAYVMNMEEVQMKTPKEETIQVVAGTPMVDSMGVPVVVASKPKIRAYSAEVEVRGEYANIRDFFNRLAHMNRLHKMTSFSLVVPKDKPKQDEPVTGVMTGKFKAEFSYFPVQNIESALNIPVFNRGEFDSIQVQKMRLWADTIVSPLENPETGRPNPFQ